MRRRLVRPPNRISTLTVAAGVLVAVALLTPAIAQPATVALSLRLPFPGTGIGGSQFASQVQVLSLTSNTNAQLAGAATVVPEVTGPQAMLIHVGGAPWGETYDPANARLFVASTSNGNVSVVDTITNRVVANVSFPAYYDSYKPIFDASDGLVYVSLSPFQMSAINATTDLIAGSTSIGSGLEGEAYDPANGDIYVADLTSNTVTVFSGENATVPFTNISAITVGQNPYGVGFDAVTGDVYVANEGDSSVSIIDCRTNQVVGLLPAIQPGPAVVADSANGNVFVGGNDVYGHANVTVINGTTNDVIATILTRNGTGGEAYDPVTGDVYVTQRYNGSTSERSVTVISGTTDRIVGSLPSQQAPIGVTYGDFNHELYVADSATGNVSLLLPLYSMSFHESGLPAGTPWAVTLNNQSVGSNDSNVSFTGADGPYHYSVQPVGNYSASPSSANFTLAGANMTLEISFSNGSTKSIPSTTYPGLTATEWGLALLVLVLIAGVAVFVLFRRRRRAGPPAGPSPKADVTGHEP